MTNPSSQRTDFSLGVTAKEHDSTYASGLDLLNVIDLVECSASWAPCQPATHGVRVSWSRARSFKKSALSQRMTCRVQRHLKRTIKREQLNGCLR